jgi:NADH-quinone oxidoreductase subunit N
MGYDNSIVVILPLVVISGAAVLVLLVDAFTSRKAVLPWVAAAGLVAAAAVALGQWIQFKGGLRFSSRRPEIGFNHMVALDKYTLFFVVLSAGIGVLTIMLSDAYVNARGGGRGEFYALLLFVIAGVVGMSMATDLIAFLVAFELMSLPTYVLAGFLRRDVRSGEASIKYFVTGAFASAILALGLALLYGITGQTNYASVGAALSNLSGGNGMATVALVLITCGFAFKVSAVPFHSWVPDVYEGAPTPVTAFMSVGVKAGAFAGFLRLFMMAAMPVAADWTNVLIILAVLTMVIGNVFALPQRNLKRLLAYSSIAHAGYILLGVIAVGQSHASSTSSPGSRAVLFYLASYALMNLGAFGILVWVRARRSFDYTLDEVAGLARTMPWAALAMSLFLLSLTGIPPTVGFWGKFYLFSAVVNARLTWLAVVAVIMSSVSAFYYLRVIWYMYFREAPEAEGDASPVQPVAGTAQDAGASLGAGAALAVAALGIVFVSFVPMVLLRFAEGALRTLLG